MNDNEAHGPVMICATRIIRPPAARIGQIGPNFTLPRTVPIKSVVAGAIGGSLGILIGGLSGSFQLILMGAIFGGFLGVVVVTISPAKGETLLQWIGVQATGRLRQRRLEFGDDHVALYIGVARLHRTAGGPTRVTRGAVDVEPSQVDERGVLRSEARGNAAPVRPLGLDLPRFVPATDLDLPDTMRREIGSLATVLRRQSGDVHGGNLDDLHAAQESDRRAAPGPNLAPRSAPGPLPSSMAPHGTWPS